jgi:hypothetical protein
MRLGSLIFVGIAVLGCKDEQSKPVPAAATGSGVAPGQSATPAAPMPSLPPGGAETFESETEDKDWAANTEHAIEAVAPELSDVDCRQDQCRATLTAATQDELVAEAQKLDSADGLRSTEARHVLLSAPETVNGKLTMKLYIQYER